MEKNSGGTQIQVIQASNLIVLLHVQVKVPQSLGNPIGNEDGRRDGKRLPFSHQVRQGPGEVLTHDQPGAVPMGEVMHPGHIRGAQDLHSLNPVGKHFRGEAIAIGGIEGLAGEPFLAVLPFEFHNQGGHPHVQQVQHAIGMLLSRQVPPLAVLP